MHINLLEIWHNMGLPVRFVVLLLTIQAICCVAVVIDRAILLQRLNTQARTFALSVQTAMEAGAYKSVLGDAAAFKGNHFADYLELGLRVFLMRQAIGDGNARSAELARRALERKGDNI